MIGIGGNVLNWCVGEQEVIGSGGNAIGIGGRVKGMR